MSDATREAWITRRIEKALKAAGSYGLSLDALAIRMNRQDEGPLPFGTVSAADIEPAVRQLGRVVEGAPSPIKWTVAS